VTISGEKIRTTARRVAAYGAVAVVALAAGAATFLAVDGPDPAEHRAAPVTTVTTTPPPTLPASTTTTAAPHDPRRGSGQAVTLAFGGDTHFEAGLHTLVLRDPDGGFLAPIAPVLGAADVAIVNLETPVTERGDPVDHQYVFRAPPAAFQALRGAGIDAVTMANNHGGDYGVIGVQDSIAAAEAAGFPVVGIGLDAAQAYAPWRVTVKDQRIAVIGATDVFEGAVAGNGQAGVAAARPVERLLAAVRDARASSDTVLVFMHWGDEGVTCPNVDQRRLERQLVDAGADIVVGAHAHVQQGAGRDGSAFVAYGLGNFIWYSEPGDSGRTGVLLVTVTGRDVDSYRWAPARIQSGVPRPLDGPAADEAVARWESLRTCAGLAP
jgi:poly-gamma-glutamate synthesis protein (capsule biosynthesis protein)